MSNNNSQVDGKEFFRNVSLIFQSLDEKQRKYYTVLAGLWIFALLCVFTSHVYAPESLTWDDVSNYFFTGFLILILPHHVQAIRVLAQDKRNSETQLETQADSLDEIQR